MTKQQQLALIYRHTHQDFKSYRAGRRAILVLRNGGTVLCPLDCLTDEEVATKLAYAKRAEEKRIAIRQVDTRAKMA